ncbi:uncharacterized protein EDB93DRAFT_1255831 [Suillus bovinus]|uniref:uncharacterized protein n=1 Tax=Suillus bovinus TaxID=48563 RepID=UPI001B87EE85|nr:uncharacterized protein EDB93DRAFT_1255831 [Suillus bovinus]KAG2130634.1 hypothetical protein EDB93DRAFT_1255831 [Suillus bovinus]
MQFSVLFSALISFVILAAASPTPGAISKRSFKRENLDINFPRDLLEETKKRERESEYASAATRKELNNGHSEYEVVP